MAGTRFTGKDMVLEFGTIDVSEAARLVTINETADPPEDVDVTVKGDTQRQLQDGLPGAIKTTIGVESLDESGQASKLASVTLNSKDTLTFYPEGKTSGKARMTLNNATFRNRTHNAPYDDAVGIGGSFDSKEGCTWDTYTT